MTTIKHIGYQGAVATAGLAGLTAAVMMARFTAGLLVGIGGFFLN